MKKSWMLFLVAIALYAVGGVYYHMGSQAREYSFGAGMADILLAVVLFGLGLVVTIYAWLHRLGESSANENLDAWDSHES